MYHISIEIKTYTYVINMRIPSEHSTTIPMIVIGIDAVLVIAALV